MRWLGVALAALVCLSVLGSLAVVARLRGGAREWYDLASSRFLLGVPWGTLAVLALVVAVYLFLQDGISDPTDPVTIPYRAWSYFSPLGVVASSFSHANLGHLVGNVAGALVVAPIAEYVWGHYPDRTVGDSPPENASSAVSDSSAVVESGVNASSGAGESTTSDHSSLPSRLYAHPRLRAFVVFPLVVVAVGVVTSLFSLGPVIGFSGLVYAFAGFAIVRYPVATLLSAVVVQGGLLTIYRALRTPVFVYVAEPSPPTAPTWATVAIQSHALGFLVGLVLAVALLDRRGYRPDPLRVWVAVSLFALSKGLWQIYWYGEGNAFVRLQGPGVAVVAVLALVITLAVAGPDRPIRSLRRLHPFERGRRSTDRSPAVDRLLELASSASAGESGRASVRFDRVTDIATGRRSREDRLLRLGTGRGTAFFAVLLVTAMLAGLAVPVNLFVLDDPQRTDGGAVEVRGYTVEYGERVDNQLVSGIGIDAVSDDAGLDASGVIVSNERRNLWWEAVPARQLEFVGEASVTVGGPGWRESVRAERVGWELTENESVYQVWLSSDETDRRLAFESGGAYADARIDGRRIAVVSRDGEFLVGVEPEQGDASTATLPATNETTETGGLAFANENGTIYAVSGETEVPVAREETDE